MDVHLKDLYILAGQERLGISHDRQIVGAQQLSHAPD